MIDVLPSLIGTFAVAGGVLAWLSIRVTKIHQNSPERLVAELRLAQFSALLLAFVAGAFIGFSATSEANVNTALDAALALGFFAVATIAPTRDPREALTILMLAFAAHALVDIMHRPYGLPVEIAPAWYLIGCAVFNLFVGVLCYIPLLRR